ncbi:MAG: hypothetical protein EZS28_000038 [Streblomastix strix]|uniref:Uncharacterized protein n=1 Tax=Streblomastix strix TaxID=222440 RepID=A0A5J4XB47_9EUKA|nr:MAG: hypothetical protein EZS28_000038 [Streblomastix strix]
MSSQQLRNLWIAILENDEKYLDEYPLIHLMKNQNEVSAAPRIFDVSIRIISILWSTKNTNVQILLCTLVQIMVQSDRILQLLQGKGCLEAVKKILQQSTDSQSLICSGKLLFLLLSTGPMINTFINIGGIEALDRIVDGQIITGQTQEIIEINRWNINLIMTLCLKIICENSEQACGLVASSSLLAKLVNISRIALDKEESRLQKDSKYNSDNKEQNIEQEVIKEENPDEQIILPVRLEIVRSTLNILCSISLYTNYRSLLITSGLLKLFHTTSSSSSQTLTQSSLLLKKNAIISITSLCEILSILLLRISQSSDSLPALTHPECVAFIVAIADVYIPNISQDDLSERILLVLTFLAEDDNTAEKLSKCKFLPSLIKRILTIILPQDEKQRSKGNKDKFGQQSSIPNLGMKLFSLLATTPDRSLHLIDYEISNLCGNILNVWNKQQIEGKDSSSESDINNVSYQIHADLLQRTVTLLCLLSIGTNPLSAQYDKLRFALTEKNLIYFVSKLLEHNFDLKANYNLQDLKANYNHQDLKANYNLQNLKAHYNLQDLKAHYNKRNKMKFHRLKYKR